MPRFAFLSGRARFLRAARRKTGAAASQPVEKTAAP